MRQRQLETFSQTDCKAICTVKGMLEAHGSGSNGDITPTHMCELLQNVRTRFMPSFFFIQWYIFILQNEQWYIFIYGMKTMR